jgi:hypothetical protein
MVLTLVSWLADLLVLKSAATSAEKKEPLLALSKAGMKVSNLV